MDQFLSWTKGRLSFRFFRIAGSSLRRYPGKGEAAVAVYDRVVDSGIKRAVINHASRLPGRVPRIRIGERAKSYHRIGGAC